MSTSFRRPSRVIAAIAATIGLSLAAASPAFADTGTWSVGGGSGATVSVADAVIIGDAIHLEGSGWLDGTDDSAADGSWIAVKLGAAAGIEPGTLTTEPASGEFVFPGATAGTAAIWHGIVADDDGDFSADIPFPTAANTSPALATAWAAGTTHHLQLLTGSVKPGGDTPRSVYVTFTVTADTLSVTAGAGGRGAPAGQVTITVAGAAGSFAANEALTAEVDGVPTAWATGGTASATGALTSTTLVYAPGTLRAGEHAVEITGPTTGTRTRTVTVLPTAAYSALTQGSEGTLTLSNLPAGSSVTAASFDGADIAFTGLPAQETDGVATASYSIPADVPLGTYPVTVTLANPASTFTLAGQKISPDSSIFGEDGFTVVSNGEGIFQGLYQSAYSSTENALFATAAAGTGTAEDGYLYKLDPDTLEIVDSVHPKDVTDSVGVAGQAPYGLGVDDVNGTVWVSNTRTNTVAVYDADDLTLLKQFPTGTISHPRDVVYDPESDRVFVSSASEGSTGDGLIMVLEADDEDGDGVRFEKIADVQTGPRTDFSPVSLDLKNGILVSPSLTSNKVVKVNTETLEFEFLEISGINVGGRGASGIEYDAENDRVYIASQNSDELVIADATTGATIKEVPTGTGALNVEVDEVNDLVYVTNFGGTTVTVLTLDGTKVANLPIARANHVTVDGAGNAFVVDKNTGNKVWKISVVDQPGTDEPGTDQPGTDEPGTDEPGTDQPGTDEPGTDLPSTGGGSIDAAPAERSLTSTTENGVSGPTTVEQGQTISVVVGTQHAGERVHAWIFSTPTDLGIHTVSAKGTIQLTIPAGLATGAHRIAVTDADGVVIGWYDVSVVAAGRLAATGSGFDGWLGAGVALTLMLAGAGAVSVSARRRAQHS